MAFGLDFADEPDFEDVLLAPPEPLLRWLLRRCWAIPLLGELACSLSGTIASRSRRRRRRGPTASARARARPASSRAASGRVRGGWATFSPRASRWSIAPRPVGGARPCRRSSSSNASGRRSRRRFRSPPNTSGSPPANVDGPVGGVQHLGGALPGRVHRQVHAGHRQPPRRRAAAAAPAASPAARAPGPAPPPGWTPPHRARARAPCSIRPRPRRSDRVQVGGQPAQAAELARRQRQRPLGAQPLAQRAQPARRRLLEQRDVPLARRRARRRTPCAAGG